VAFREFNEMPDETRIKVRLIHDGTQPGAPVIEPVDFGLQDKRSDIHAGKPSKGGRLRFDVELEIRPGASSDPPVFSGPFAHGPPAARFLYLSWKKQGHHAHPWAWRIKIPLAGIGWSFIRQARESGQCVEADVVGRRPHVTEAIRWRLAK
jgi:hypothetical protein